MRGAQIVIKTLKAAGVKSVFALSGNQIMPLFDACLDEGIEIIHVRHEAAAVHMADAWGRLTARPGVALVSAGPGHANALSALYVALAAESPVVLLSGSPPTSEIGRGAFQEMDQRGMAAAVTKQAWTAGFISELSPLLRTAWRTALEGRPGPVQISLPYDVLTGENCASPFLPAADFEPISTRPQPGWAETAFEALSAARRPLIVGGPALSRGQASELLRQLGRRSGIPAIAMESPRGKNDPAQGALAEVLAQADAMLLLAKPLDCTLGFGQPPVVADDCRFLIVEPDAMRLESTRRRNDVGPRIVSTTRADATAAIEQLLACSANAQPKQNDWPDEVRAATEHRPAEWREITSPAEGPVHPVELCRQVGRMLASALSSVLVCDGGEFGQWPQACLSPARRVINGPSGSIGGSMSFALAARLAYPDSLVVAMLGDGTFGFHGLEFDTAVRYQIPFVAVVGNDACWNAEYQVQLRHYGPERAVGCELLPTRYDLVAQALGGHGEHVLRPADLPAALQRAVASNLPACVNVAIPRDPAPVVRRDN